MSGGKFDVCVSGVTLAVLVNQLETGPSHGEGLVVGHYSVTRSLSDSDETVQQHHVVITGFVPLKPFELYGRDLHIDDGFLCDRQRQLNMRYGTTGAAAAPAACILGWYRVRKHSPAGAFSMREVVVGGRLAKTPFFTSAAHSSSPGPIVLLVTRAAAEVGTIDTMVTCYRPVSCEGDGADAGRPAADNLNSARLSLMTVTLNIDNLTASSWLQYKHLQQLRKRSPAIMYPCSSGAAGGDGFEKQQSPGSPIDNANTQSRNHLVDQALPRLASATSAASDAVNTTVLKMQAVVKKRQQLAELVEEVRSARAQLRDSTMKPPVGADGLGLKAAATTPTVDDLFSTSDRKDAAASNGVSAVARAHVDPTTPGM